MVYAICHDSADATHYYAMLLSISPSFDALLKWAKTYDGPRRRSSFDDDCIISFSAITARRSSKMAYSVKMLSMIILEEISRVSPQFHAATPASLTMQQPRMLMMIAPASMTPVTSALRRWSLPPDIRILGHCLAKPTHY